MSWWQMVEPWWTYAVRGFLVYVGLLVLLRLSGKRSFGEMSAFDVIILVLVGGTLRSAVVGADTSMASAFIGVAAMLATDKLLGWACARSPRLNRWIEGYPAIITRNGKRLVTALKREGLSEAAFERALHAAGRADESDIAIGRLEPNGKITLIPKKGSL